MDLNDWFEAGASQTSLTNASDLTTVAFDPCEELFWTGASNGHVTNFYSRDVERRLAWTAHREPVLSVVPLKEIVITVAGSSFRTYERGGLLLNEFQSPGNRLGLWQPIASNFVVGGSERALIFDLELQQIVRESKSIDTTCMSSGLYLCCGGASGTAEFRDPRSLRVEHTAILHTGMVMDMHVKGDMLISCGVWGSSYQPDRFIKVYDLRTLRPLQSVSFAPGAQYLKFLPQMSSTFVALSSSGVLQFLDAFSGSASSEFIEMGLEPGAVMTTMDISSTGQSMVFGNSHGVVRQWLNSPDSLVNSYSNPSEPLVFPPIMEDTGFSTPLAYMPGTDLVENTAVELLSSQFQMSAKPRYYQPVDASLIPNLKYRDGLGIAPHPGGNFAPNCMSSLARFFPSRKQAQTRSKETDPVKREYAKVTIKQSRHLDFSKFNKTAFAALDNSLPNSYCNAALQMLFFTRGLREHLAGHLCEKAACIPCELSFLFDMMRQTKVVEPRNFARVLGQTSEITALGLMIPEPGSIPRNIQDFLLFLLNHLSTNFISLDTHQEQWFVSPAKPAKTQSRISSKTAEQTPEKPPTYGSQGIVSYLTGFELRSELQCLEARHMDARTDSAFVCKLLYPVSTTAASFSAVLRDSLVSEATRRVFCPKCNCAQMCKTVRMPTTLPLHLHILANVQSHQEAELWKSGSGGSALYDVIEQSSARLDESIDEPRVDFASGLHGANITPFAAKQMQLLAETVRQQNEVKRAADAETTRRQEVQMRGSWLPAALRITLNPNATNLSQRITVEEFNTSELPPAPRVLESVIVMDYDLSAVISHITQDGGAFNDHLVLQCRVPAKNLAGPGWMTFNDLCVTPTTMQEARDLHPRWKQPCVVQFTSRTSLQEKLPPALPPRISQMVFMNNPNLSMRHSLYPRTFEPLQRDEIKSGSLVAIDCEFVLVENEEKIGSDVVKPARHALARVSVCRGEGPRAGVPFIDDYIVNAEEVVDYLTQFSGLVPGDLDPALSMHHLTTQKSAYVRLRSLVDRGVRFVGHGLTKDFQMINIVVPADQIADTVEMYHLEDDRYLSLRFLAAHVLGRDIQSATHDSIEDARTALELFNKYEEARDSGELQRTVEQLYAIGRQSGFKI
jgi:PAB-dependent poly(A)-specific ribonuclease subunit 2